MFEGSAARGKEWGEISIDFLSETGKAIRLADWDTMDSHNFGNRAINHLLDFDGKKNPYEVFATFYFLREYDMNSNF